MKKRKNYKTLNKSSKISAFNEDYDNSKKRWKNESTLKTTKKSTLSLHIAAYKNSTEAAALDLFDDENIEGLKKERLGSIKTSKHCFTDRLMNPFEFPRQQNGNQRNEPEVLGSQQPTMSQQIGNNDEQFVQPQMSSGAGTAYTSITMLRTPEPKKPSTPVYAVYSSASPRVIYANSVKEVRTHLSTPEFRNSDGRFKTFQSIEESETYFSKNPVSKMLTPTSGMHTRNEDGYRSPFPKLRPQELSKFLKLIQTHDNVEAIKYMDENPHYFIDMSIDQPSILHIGCRHNALHICARYGNLFIAMEIMRRIRDLKYISSIYNTSASIEETSDILIDRFLNNPDKQARRTPILWAARQGFLKFVMFISSFPQLQFPDNEQLKDIQCQFHERNEHVPKCSRILDCLRHPSMTYCITLYKESNDEALPFIAITSRFPPPLIFENQKQSYFKTLPASTFTGRPEDGITSVRISKFINENFLSYDHQHEDSINCTETYVPYASLGVFGEKWIAATFYQMWAAQFKKQHQDPSSCRDYLANVGVRLADSNDYYLYYSNLTGIIIPENKFNELKRKLQFVNNSDAEETFLKAFENLTVSEIQSKNVFNFVEINETEDDQDFYTPPTSRETSPNPFE